MCVTDVNHSTTPWKKIYYPNHNQMRYMYGPPLDYYETFDYGHAQCINKIHNYGGCNPFSTLNITSTSFYLTSTRVSNKLWESHITWICYSFIRLPFIWYVIINCRPDKRSLFYDIRLLYKITKRTHCRDPAALWDCKKKKSLQNGVKIVNRYWVQVARWLEKRARIKLS